MNIGFTASAVVLALATTLAPARPVEIAIALKARGQQPGELVLVNVTAGPLVNRVDVRVFDREVAAFRVSQQAWRALVGIDLDTKPGTYPIEAAARSDAGTERAMHNLVVTDREFPTRRLTVDENFVTPPAEVTERIAREAKELEQLWIGSAPERLWSGAFERPVPHDANSAFGSRSIFNGQPRSPHSGADFSSPAGTPIKSPNAGRIVLAKDLYFSGNTVIIDHGLGLFSTMAHLSSIDVKPGDVVRTGQVVGLVGATGRVTGAHLHWAVRLGGARIDPLSVLALLGGS
jgi:biotin carboxyl carrier protein